MKSKALLIWCIDKDSDSNDSSESMVNLALVSLEGSSETEYVGSDTISEVNSINSELHTDNAIVDDLKMQGDTDLSMMKLMELKNENYELKNENVHLRKVISDYMVRNISNQVWESLQIFKNR